MDKQSEQWGAGDSEDFWGAPTVAQRLAARRKAERESYAVGWSRIFYAAAAAVVLSTWVVLTLR